MLYSFEQEVKAGSNHEGFIFRGSCQGSLSRRSSKVLALRWSSHVSPSPEYSQPCLWGGSPREPDCIDITRKDYPNRISSQGYWLHQISSKGSILMIASKIRTTKLNASKIHESILITSKIFARILAGIKVHRKDSAWLPEGSSQGSCGISLKIIVKLLIASKILASTLSSSNILTRILTCINEDPQKDTECINDFCKDPKCMLDGPREDPDRKDPHKDRSSSQGSVIIASTILARIVIASKTFTRILVTSKILAGIIVATSARVYYAQMPQTCKLWRVERGNESLSQR